MCSKREMNGVYSRQVHALGQEVMESLMQSSVLIRGMGGVGFEIAKNLVLMGVKQITLQDAACVQATDLGVNPFFSTKDAAEKRNRAIASAKLLRQVNVDVEVQTRTTEIESETDLGYLTAYQCVILTETPLDVQIKVNNFCRSQNPPIKFIVADVFGVAGTTFHDFGEKHVVFDVDDDLHKIFIGDVEVRQGKVVITAAENRHHHLETGDMVELNHITGLEELNGVVATATVTTSDQFELKDWKTSELKGNYVRGGVCRKVAKPKTVCFKSLQTQIWKPDILALDATEERNLLNIHLAIVTLHTFFQMKKKNSIENLECFMSLAHKLSQDNAFLNGNLDDCILKTVFLASGGQLQPLVALVGGAAAHETMKALGRKYIPCKQFYVCDALQLAISENQNVAECKSLNQEVKDDRWLLKKCIGLALCKKLADSSVFIAGCSAIGCEILKNLAMIGVASGRGKIKVADGNFVRRPNLSSQFLFRSQDVGLPKCVRASTWVRSVRPATSTESFHCYITPDSCVLSDDVLKDLGVVVSSLDSVDARRYIDKRCVQGGCPLIDVGMEGSKGHVQVIVPHLTESYTSMADPDLSEKYPYCTIASFPYRVEHTVQWACERFKVLFMEKPKLFNQFWKQHGSPLELVKKMEIERSIQGMRRVAMMLRKKPKSWEDCVKLARIKFEKYFRFKALQLLHVMPADLRDKDGLLFWRSLKRPPTPIQFSWQNDLHRSFVISTSKLLAAVWGIDYRSDDAYPETISSILSTVAVPQFSDADSRRPLLVEEESVPKIHPPQDLMDDYEFCLAVFRENVHVQVTPTNPQCLDITSDGSCPLDFITAAANLRAVMYEISTTSKQIVQFMIGHMVPAIATTSSVIGALATIEIMKVIMKSKDATLYRNSFVNLSEPCYVFAEPKSPERIDLENGKSFTMWDYFEIQGNPNMVLEQFLALLTEKIGLNPSMVVYGTRMLWVSILPGHAKRKASTMMDLIGPEPRQRYVELTVAFEKLTGEEVMGPPVRYVF